MVILDLRITAITSDLLYRLIDMINSLEDQHKKEAMSGECVLLLLINIGLAVMSLIN